MSLLAPLFLIGLGLLALPIWLHRLQTDNPERETFASTMFLEATRDPVHVRRQLQHLLLLLLRLLFLALLVFAFARPAFDADSNVISGSQETMHIVVIDASASMSASAVLTAAKSKASEIVAEAGSAEAIKLYRFGTDLDEVANSADGIGSLAGAIGNIEPSPVYGDLGNMMAGLSQLDWSEPLRYQVHIISDLQKTALPDRYADLIPDLPANTQISFNAYPVGSESTSNWLIDYVREEEQGLRVGVRGLETPEQELDLSLRVNNGNSIQKSLVVSESGRANVFFPNIEYTPSMNSVEVRILNEGLAEIDNFELDNHYHLVVNRQPPEPVLLLTSNPFGAAANYLSAVLSSVQNVESAGSQRNAYSVQPQSLTDFDIRTLSRYSWLIIDDIGAIDSNLAEAIKAYVEEGGALIAGAGDQTTGLEALPVFGQSLLPQGLETAGQFLVVSHLDRSHQILNGLEGWPELRLSRFVDIEASAVDQVLVSLDNGAPLLVEQKIGRGKQLLLTSAFDNQWNNLPVKPLYVSFMSRVAGYLSGAGGLNFQHIGGNSFSFGEELGGSGQLIDPAGKAVLSLGNTNRSTVHQLNKLGFYQAITASREALVAVNLHPSESDLKQMDEAEIERWLAVLADQGVAQSTLKTELSEAGTAQVEVKQNEIWFALLCLAALLLVCESVFANFQINRKSMQRAQNAAV